MKKIAKLIIVLLISCVGVSQLANAVSWSPVEEKRDEKIAKGIKVKGEIACLFESGAVDVKQAISLNDILIVYRENPSHQLKEVGKIKVLSYVRKYYLKGEVVEGEIRAGDIAKKGDIASLVLSSDTSCK